jgi:[acyl-carrier-protein] S-malonyltransferase
MRPAQEQLRADLDGAPFADLAIPLVNNWQARIVTSAADAREGLYQQVPSPVRWIDSMRLLIAEGVTQWAEVGAGAVLTGLLRNIDSSQTCHKFGEISDSLPFAP